MAQTAGFILLFSLCIAVVTAETNICFDDKEYLENMSEYQKECGGNGATKPEKELIYCVYNKMGIVKENGDSFDFAKTKDHILSEIKDQKKKDALEKDLIECETAHPTGDLGYYSCFVEKFRQKCYQ